MKHLVTWFWLFLALSCLCGCLANLQRFSARSPGSAPVPVPVPVDQTEGSTAPKTVFLKKTNPKIVPTRKERGEGSLFSLEDENNQFFTQPLVGKVGSSLNVVFESKPKEEKKKGAAASSAAKKEAPAAAGRDAEAKPEGEEKLTEEEELLKKLPNLDPGTGPMPALLKQIKMKVLHRYENGDVLAGFERYSQTEAGVHETSVQARVPYASIVAGKPVMASDLADISFREEEGGELIERSSPNWEDEYTLRLSGFSEAKSRVAVAIEEKQKELLEARQKVEERLVAIGKERKQMAIERDKLLEENRKGKAQIDELTKKVAEQDGKLQEQAAKDADEEKKGEAPAKEEANAEN